MKNQLLKFLVRLFRSSPKNYSHKTFLIVSTTGLGDTLFGTPALAALKKAAPQARIVVLTSPIGEEVLRHHPAIDQIYTLGKPLLLSLLFFYRKLKKEKITEILFFHTSQRLILPYLSLLGAEKQIGIEGEHKGLDSLLSHLLPRKQLHEVEKRFSLLQAAGITPHPFPLQIFLPPSASPLSYPQPLLCIHPGAKDPFKEWAESHFIALGRRLQKEFGGTLVITGTVGEKERVERITSSIPGALSLYPSLTDLGHLLQKAALFIVGDTGPMHLAFALKTPTIALFGPTDPALCGPFLAEEVTLIQVKTTCTPCLRKKCLEPFCLLQISVSSVYDAARRRLENG